MHYLIYLSTAVTIPSEQELADILTKSKANNKENNITGMLLYAGGTFIQVLEGDEKDVNLTYYRITHDKRHKNFIKLISGDVANRAFPEWNMGLVTLNTDKLKELEGYIDPSNALYKGTESHPAITVLKTFVESNKSIGSW